MKSFLQFAVSTYFCQLTETIRSIIVVLVGVVWVRIVRRSIAMTKDLDPKFDGEHLMVSSSIPQLDETYDMNLLQFSFGIFGRNSRHFWFFLHFKIYFIRV